MSYTWGNPFPEQDHSQEDGPYDEGYGHDDIVICNDEYLCVTKSLRDALDRLSQAAKCPALWVDVICITQDDADERNAEVAIMDRTYTTAGRTVIWLEPATGDMPRLLSIMAHLSNLTEEQEKGLKTLSPRDLELQRLLGLLDTAYVACDMIGALFRRRWFR